MARRRRKQRPLAAVVALISILFFAFCGYYGISTAGLRGGATAETRRIAGAAKAVAKQTRTLQRKTAARRQNETAEASKILRGRVVRVYDGDTITVLIGNKREKIRFQGIDAPESKQAYGAEARNALARLVHSRDVVIEYSRRDDYGRILGRVKVDGADAGLMMLKAGFAWHYSHFDNTPAYAAAEREARAAKRGLWADPNPQNPYDFRKAQKRAAAEK